MPETLLPSASKTTELRCDTVIMGGGVAGLWLLNHLSNQGYNALLFERHALGCGQTIASQGMIHGGIKYTLGGTLSGASEAIADMPEHWRRCLRGEGDVDLKGTQLLSEHFYLWSSSGAASKMTTFLASKMMRGRVGRLKNRDLPAIFQHPDFSGSVYRLVDMVMDTPSLLAKLADNYRERIFLLPAQQAHWLTDPGGTMHLRISGSGQDYSIRASAFIFAAGSGNESLLNQVGAQTPKMQRRPLRQVMVKHRYPHPFFGHCLGAEKTPRLTISSYAERDGTQIWYLGGSLAEKGVGQSEAELIHTAQRELHQLMPWVNLANAQWGTLAIDRAEPRQRDFARPDQAFAAWAEGANCGNILAAWPTKLTLCPNLGVEVSRLLKSRNIMPGSRVDAGDAAITLPELDRPTLANYPWKDAFD